MPEKSAISNAPKSGSWALFAVGIVLLCIIVAAVHWPVLSAQALSLDDGDFLQDNPLVQNPSWDSAKRFLGEVLEPTTVKGYYLPLSMISLMTDYAMGGRPDNLFAFHRTSLVLHILNVALVAILLRMLFGNATAAIITALIFGLHPLTVEPIAWVGERKTLLAMFFALLTIIAYLKSTHGRRWAWMTVASLMYVLALMSKPTAVPLPLLLVVMDYWPLNRSIRQSLIEKAPLFLLAGLFAVVTLVSHFGTAGGDSTTVSGPVDKALLLCHLSAFYGQKILFPFNLSSVYPLPAPISLANPTILVGMVVTVLLVAGLFYSAKKTRVFLGGGMFFFFAMSPTLGIVQYSWIYASDKYVYLPAIGLLMILAWCLIKVMQSRGRQKILACAGIIGVLCIEVVGVRMYLPQWRDTMSLSQYILSKAPGTPQIHVNLGDAYEQAGRRDDAKAEYRAAIKNMPNYALAHNNLGTILALEGRFSEAIEQFHIALKSSPKDAPAHCNLAVALLESGRVDEAQEFCGKAIRLKPGYPKPLYVMGDILRDKGDFDGAIESYRKAIAVHENYVEAWQHLANALQMSGRSSDAIAAYQQWLQLDPASSLAHHNLAMALRAQGNDIAAAQHLREAIKLDPEYADAHNNLGISLAAQGQTNQAIEHFLEALELNPEYGEAYHNVALVFQQMGRHRDAAANFRKSAELSPDDPQAHFVLGVSLSLNRDAAGALVAFEKMLALDPSNPGAQNSVAWILASSADDSIRDAERAIAIAKEAADRTQYRQPQVLDTLATAYAAAGRFDDAVMTIRKALEIAEAQPNRVNAAGIKKRLALFESGVPYTE